MKAWQIERVRYLCNKAAAMKRKAPDKFWPGFYGQLIKMAKREVNRVRN